MQKLWKVAAFVASSLVVVLIGLAIFNRVKDRVPFLKTVAGEGA